MVLTVSITFFSCAWISEQGRKIETSTGVPFLWRVAMDGDLPRIRMCIWGERWAKTYKEVKVTWIFQAEGVYPRWWWWSSDQEVEEGAESLWKWVYACLLYFLPMNQWHRVSLVGLSLHECGHCSSSMWSTGESGLHWARNALDKSVAE